MSNPPLERWQKDDATRLKAAWVAFKDANDINQEEAASRLGITQSAFSQYINGRIPLNVDKLMSFANLLGVETHDISPTLAQRIPGRFNEPFEKRDGYYVLKTDRENTTQARLFKGDVPVISSVQAGEPNFAVDLLEPGDAERWVPGPPRSYSSKTYALRVEGDSMTAPYGKSYPHGCLIYVDPEQRGGCVTGDRVVAQIRGHDAVTFKQLAQVDGRQFLKPLNPQYPPIMDEFRVLGKVIGKWEDD